MARVISGGSIFVEVMFFEVSKTKNPYIIYSSYSIDLNFNLNKNCL